jgi:hypothetical protein
MHARYPHPEQDYRACLGLLSLVLCYAADRVNAACTGAHAAGMLAYRSVTSILEQPLDRLRLDRPTVTRLLPAHHETVRGPAYYDTTITSAEPMPEPTLLLPRRLLFC